MSGKLKFLVFVILLPLITLIYGTLVKRYDIALNSAFTIGCIIAALIIHKKVPVFSTRTFYSVIIFILLSVFLGRSLNIYSVIPFWDKMLHFLSGFIIASAGSEIYIRLNGNKRNKALMNLFIFLFAVSAAGIWEIYEFTVDNIFGTNSQNASLTDTMLDMTAGTVSAAIAIFLKKFTNINS